MGGTCTVGRGEEACWGNGGRGDEGMIGCFIFTRFEPSVHLLAAIVVKVIGRQAMDVRSTEKYRRLECERGVYEFCCHVRHHRQRLSNEPEDIGARYPDRSSFLLRYRRFDFFFVQPRVW